MSLDQHFNEYFSALDRTGGGEDRCFLCRRSPAEVKRFFGFHEDGTPIDADQYGIEDIALESLDIMSYRGSRPVCAVCQLNYDVIFMAGGHALLRQILSEMENKREELWPDGRRRGGEAPEPDAPEGGSSDTGGDEEEPEPST